MREGRERETKLNFLEVPFCFSYLTFHSVRNSAVYKRIIILQMFCKVLDLCQCLSCSTVALQMGDNWSF